MEAEQLLAKVVAGDERAWHEVVDRFAGLVWSVARSYRLPNAVTEDVVQTVWLRLAEHAARIRQADRLAAWLATTTRNEALRAVRHVQRNTPSDRFAERADDTLMTIDERVSDDVTLNAVLEAFAELSPEDQQLMRLLCTVPPLDYQTIADMLGRPIGSIGPTRARCLTRLRKLLPPGIDPKEGLS
ncbi:MAG: RNA polymerase sigma factor [Desertimonas sp.]